MKTYYKILLSIPVFLALAFQPSDNNLYEFNYPKQDKTTISFNTSCKFKNFTKEWRDKDYYYMGQSTDSIICSVLYYKLNKEDQKLLTKPFGDIKMAGIPFAYFSESSNLKKYEVNKKAWGKMDDDFMFRQCDILEFQGVKLKQKHMYAYAMISNDIFINFHLSKTNYKIEDSIKMMNILNSLIIKK